MASKIDSLKIDSVWTSPDPVRSFWHGFGSSGATVKVRVWGSVGRKRFEFAWLGEGHQVEVYDHPKSWEGSPRFVGHMPLESGAKLLTMARGALVRVTGAATSNGETVAVS